MALLHLAYERLLAAIHNEQTLDSVFRVGPSPWLVVVRRQMVLIRKR